MGFKFNPLTGQFDIVESGAGGSGETNTGSNVGVDGVGVFDAKVGVDLQFRNIAPASSKITVTLNVDDIDLDVVDANIDHNNLFNTHNLTTDIDHDALTNYVANEHIDWTNATNNLLTTGSIEGDSVRITAASDHLISDSTNDWVFTNGNQDKNIIFNVNRGGTSGDLLTIDGSSGLVQVNAVGTATYGLNGQFRIGGSVNASTFSGGLAMNPTVTGATYWIANIVQPTINSDSIALAFYLNPSFGATNNQSIETVRTVAPLHKAGYNDTFKALTTVNTSYVFIAYTANDASTVTYDWIGLGGAVTVGDTGFTNTDFSETVIKLTGGATRGFGTNGSINQKGIHFTGYGTQSGLIGGTDSSHAIYADGGTFSFKFDYNGSSNALLFGAGEDAGIGYDGTDFVIDSSLVGTGTIKLASSNNWTANGTNTVTISNVAPAGVGTATVSKWLTIKDDSGNTYYIPAWT